MTNVENILERAWRDEICSRRAQFGRNSDSTETRGIRRVHRGSGEAAPAPSGEAGSIRNRRAAQACRQSESTGAAQRQQEKAAVPIWLAALSATGCLARTNGEDHDVRWNCVAGRALYTNAGADTETIHPLGVSLERGQTLAVYWMPGETAYTLEVFRN